MPKVSLRPKLSSTKALLNLIKRLLRTKRKKIESVVMQPILLCPKQVWCVLYSSLCGHLESVGVCGAFSCLLCSRVRSTPERGHSDTRYPFFSLTTVHSPTPQKKNTTKAPPKPIGHQNLFPNCHFQPFALLFSRLVIPICSFFYRIVEYPIDASLSPRPQQTTKFFFFTAHPAPKKNVRSTVRSIRIQTVRCTVHGK